MLPIETQMDLRLTLAAGYIGLGMRDSSRKRCVDCAHTCRSGYASSLAFLPSPFSFSLRHLGCVFDPDA